MSSEHGGLPIVGTSEMPPIEREGAWREIGAHVGRVPVFATRWLASDRHEASAHVDQELHTVAIALRRSRITFRSSEGTSFDGTVMPGAVQISSPGTRVSCTFLEPSDFLHLHLHDDFLLAYRQQVDDGSAQAAIRLVDPGFAPDRQLEGLARMLVAADLCDDSFAPVYAGSIAVAMAGRLISAHSLQSERPRSRVAPLPKWRLKRVIDHVDAALSGPISLPDLAAAAGLTRMHFAAQFRAATGLSPHEYVLHRRIERACELLRSSSLKLVDVALTVGFQSQTHFSTVFKRFCGQSPRQWRQANMPSSALLSSEPDSFAWKVAA